MFSVVRLCLTSLLKAVCFVKRFHTWRIFFKVPLSVQMHGILSLHFQLLYNKFHLVFIYICIDFSAMLAYVCPLP